MIHPRTLLTTLLLAITGAAATADEPPLWDLAKNDIPAAQQSGSVEKADGVVKLRDGSSFAVPAQAFPDQKNFTVQVTLSLDALVQDSVFTVMNKQSSDKDDGFAMFFNYKDKPNYARQVNSVVNKVLMVGGAINGRNEPEINKPVTFTMAVRSGLATFYIDDAPIKKCFMEIIPNDGPMWIGRNDNAKSKTMPVTVSWRGGRQRLGLGRSKARSPRMAQSTHLRRLHLRRLQRPFYCRDAQAARLCLPLRALRGWRRARAGTDRNGRTLQV